MFGDFLQKQLFMLQLFLKNKMWNKVFQRQQPFHLQTLQKVLTVGIQPLRQLQYQSSSAGTSCQPAQSPKSSQASRLLHRDISTSASHCWLPPITCPPLICAADGWLSSAWPVPSCRQNVSPTERGSEPDLPFITQEILTRVM